MEQEKIYSLSEANNWFSRNKQALLERESNSNQVIKFLRSYNFHPTCILDLGCSNGYFLYQLKSELNCEAFGVDLSEDAISDGKVRYDGINLFHRSANDLNIFENEKFDLVYVSGLLCIIDRSFLFRVVAEIDRVLKNKGILIISDFEAAFPLKSNYVHVPGNKVFAYKQDYAGFFTASNLYKLMGKYSLNTSNRDFTLSDEYNSWYNYTILKKDYDLYSDYKPA